MARGKKGKKSVRSAPMPVEPQQKTERKKKRSDEAPRGRFSFLDYLFICAFFVAFCFIQKYFAIWLLETEVSSSVQQLDESALNFFFNTMWQGFLIVAILVAIHDFFYRSEEEEESS